jgi:hypothetical protein
MAYSKKSVEKRENARKLTPKEAAKVLEEINAAPSDPKQAKPSRKNAKKKAPKKK